MRNKLIHFTSVFFFFCPCQKEGASWHTPSSAWPGARPADRSASSSSIHTTQEERTYRPSLIRYDWQHGQPISTLSLVTFKNFRVVFLFRPDHKLRKHQEVSGLKATHSSWFKWIHAFTDRQCYWLEFVFVTFACFLSRVGRFCSFHLLVKVGRLRCLLV